VVEKAIAARPFWGAPLRATFPTAVGPKNFTTPLKPLYPVFRKRTTTIGRRAGHTKAAASKCARSIEIKVIMTCIKNNLNFTFFQPLHVCAALKTRHVQSPPPRQGKARCSSPPSTPLSQAGFFARAHLPLFQTPLFQLDEGQSRQHTPLVGVDSLRRRLTTTATRVLPLSRDRSVLSRVAVFKSSKED
jgi:hypothetical protein